MLGDLGLALAPVYGPGVGISLGDLRFLYELLRERDIATVGISHKVMPTYRAHTNFVSMKPYKDWCIIWRHEDAITQRVGMVYLSYQREIGIQVLREWQGNGYAEWAVRQMIARHPEVREFLANINPRNQKSLALFAKLGFSCLQVTWHLVTGGDTDGEDQPAETGQPGPDQV